MILFVYIMKMNLNQKLPQATSTRKVSVADTCRNTSENNAADHFQDDSSDEPISPNDDLPDNEDETLDNDDYWDDPCEDDYLYDMDDTDDEDEENGNDLSLEMAAKLRELNDNEAATNKHIEQPKGRGFKDVIGLEELKSTMTRSIIYVLKNPETAKRYRITIPNGMLLYGPPGCGKTFIARKFAEESGLRFRMVSGSTVSSTLVHGTQLNIATLFSRAAKYAPIVLCFDEFDAFVPRRSSTEGKDQAGEVNEFLTQLNNCGSRGIFVIGTTNRPDIIDPAVLRSGRMDKLVYVAPPNYEVRRRLFLSQIMGRPCEEIDFDKLAKATEFFVPSDIVNLINDAALDAALNLQPITTECLLKAITTAHHTLSPSILHDYERLRQQMEPHQNKPMRRIGF